MFTVEITSMPAASSSSTSCHRFSLREPGTFVCASSSTSATFGRRARSASTSISSKDEPRYSMRRRGTTSRSSICAAVFSRPCVSTNPMTTSVPREHATATFVEHREGLADTGSRSEIDAELPASHRVSLRSRRLVQRDVELEHVDAGLAEEAERATVRVLVDELPDLRQR